jgi:hypothetical protein
MTTITTTMQMPLKDVPKGEYIRRKLDAKTTYVRGDFDRSTKTYSLSDCEDFCREIFLKGTTLVWVGFEY